jgi:type IX secretion system PorP/SprF family membrane protein
LGLKVLADKIGYTSITDIDLSYAYAIYLNREWQLNLGVSASYQTFNYDIGDVILSNPNEALPYESDHNFNTDLGFEFSNQTWRFGGASQNFLTVFRNPNYTPGEFVSSGSGLKISELHPNTNLAYAMYKHSGNTFVNLGGGICGIQTGNVLQAEMNLTAFFKRTTETNAFQLGAFYRTWHEMGLLFGIHLDRMRIYYSYDFNVGEIYRNLLGTHEIILTYKLNRTYRCRNCWY